MFLPDTGTVGTYMQQQSDIQLQKGCEMVFKLHLKNILKRINYVIFFPIELEISLIADLAC